MMGKLGIAEDEPIQNRMITRSLESAQEKIEGLNFDARKHVLEFDDVLNYQRKIMYGRRREVLLGDRERIINYIKEILAFATEDESKVIMDRLDNADSAYTETLRRVILQATDMYWVEHLEVMDYMRSSVNLRAYGQRDPLVEYKREGLRLFKEMEVSVANEIIKLIPQIKTNEVFFDEPVKLKEIKDNSSSLTQETVSSSSISVKNSEGDKVGRNDPCPCGSGKKYKSCGLINSEEHKKRMK
jgi:preprotein translocase subunit SecA